MSTTAAKPTRDHATNPGGTPSSTATLMNRYGIPQRIDMVAKAAQARGLIRSRVCKCEVMPRIGLGLAAIGRPAYINLKRARDLGADRSVERLRAEAET